MRRVKPRIRSRSKELLVEKESLGKERIEEEKDPSRTGLCSKVSDTLFFLLSFQLRKKVKETKGQRYSNKFP